MPNLMIVCCRQENSVTLVKVIRKSEKNCRMGQAQEPSGRVKITGDTGLKIVYLRYYCIGTLALHVCGNASATERAVTAQSMMRSRNQFDAATPERGESALRRGNAK